MYQDFSLYQIFYHTDKVSFLDSNDYLLNTIFLHSIEESFSFGLKHGGQSFILFSFHLLCIFDINWSSFFCSVLGCLVGVTSSFFFY
eukprot:UN01192